MFMKQVDISLICIYDAKLDNLGCAQIDFIWFRSTGPQEFVTCGVWTMCAEHASPDPCEEVVQMDSLFFASFPFQGVNVNPSGSGLTPNILSLLPANLYSHFSIFTLPLVKE